MSTNKTNGNDTIGAATIVDRVEGWGHTLGADSARKDNATWGNAAGNSITATDASKESTDDRADRLLVARKQGTPTITPDTQDRSKGLGGASDTTAGADAGYRTGGPDDIWAAESASIGTDYDVEFSGSNTEYDETTSTEFLASGRTSTALPTSAVAANRASLEKVGNTNTVGSIVDRTSGFGHTAGSQSDRHD